MKKATFIFFYFLLMQLTCIGQDFNLDSVKYVAETTKNDTEKFRALTRLTFYYTWANPDSAHFYANKELELANKLNSDGWKTKAFIDMGMVLGVMGNYSQALDLALNAKELSEKTEMNKFSINVYLCIIYRDQGDFENARNYAFKALSLSDSLGGNYEIALGHIGSVYEKFGHLDSALLYINKAYEIDKNSDRKWTLLPNTMGNIYEKMGKYDMAIQYFREGILLAKEQVIIRDLVDIYNGLANIFLKIGQIDSCVFYAKEIIKINQKTSYPLSAMEASDLLSNLYKSKNDKDSIIKYMELSAVFRDSLFNREKQRQFQNISIAELQRAQEIKVAKQAFQNRIRTNALLGSSFTLIVVAILLFILFRRKQKAKLKIELAFDQLKATQAQLIQSEKMASLGELTAGIAHEIQNPLNFVNNFSEVNSELTGELEEEIKKGNIEEVISILKDIRENESKISQHGKRAETIVKGMLLHSRGSSGKKEPTDINALCDEYLRLAYHGFRAKDKSFNANFKLELDESLPKIEVVPQDIGKVLLNLINNAFYAVKAPPPPKGRIKKNQSEYKPLVIVKTSYLPPSGGTRGVRITVADNGPGIPSSIIDKIFQPFFTTKSTGEGTGLGLSLSYDIVKAHGGKITVESANNAGTIFIIQLPIKLT